MLLLKRFIPFISALFIFITFEIWLLEPDFTYYCIGINVFLVILSVWILSGFYIAKKKFWNILITPFFYILSIATFFLLIDNEIVQHVYSALAVLVLYLVLKNIFSFLYNPKSYQPYALENIYSYVNLISLFLFYCVFYGTILFLGWPAWVLTIFVLISTAFLFMRTLWSYKIEWQTSKLFIGSLAVIIAQSFYIISFLPTSYPFNALMVILIYYILMNVMKDHLQNTLNKKNIKNYLIISMIILIISFLTTQWY